MLVKVISYVITLVGTKRYKPLLLSGLAIAMTLAGVTTLVQTYRAPSRTAASVNQTKDEQPTSSGHISKQDLQKEQPADQSAVPAQPVVPDANTAPASPTQPSTEVAIALTPAEGTVTLKRDNGVLTATVNAALSDASKATWTVTSVSGLTATASAGNQPAATQTTVFKADSSLTPGQYSVIIQAKDSGRGLDLSKTVSVIVPAE